jgi:tryptophanyl-tRNA synthetase
VAEHAELALMFSMVTPLSSLENNPTWKEQLQELAKTKAGLTESGESAKYEENRAGANYELRTYGFLGYPVLQAADILLYHGTKVPVGHDQLPHLELSREIARKFNRIYGEIFDEPQPLLTPTPRVSGLDGRKMSKSYGNAVDIFETEESLKTKILSAYTDPTRKRATDPGHPEPCPENPPGCTVYSLHALYSPPAFTAQRGEECRAGTVGCMACKKDLVSTMNGPFAKFRERRQAYAADPAQVEAILEDGARRARGVAQKTMDEVRRAMRLR